MKVEPKTYQCTACGHKQSISTNHDGECLNYCHGCSWKVNAYSGVHMFGHMYRSFKVAQEVMKPTEERR